MGKRNEIATHHMLAEQTGVHKLTKEQLEAMDRIMGETTLNLEEDLAKADPDATMDLPILARRRY